MKSRSLLAIAGAVALASCANLGIQTEAQKIAASCATASASIKVLTAANELGHLSSDAQSSVRAAIVVIEPICTSPEPPTLDDIKRQAFLMAITALQIAAVKAQEDSK